MSTEKTRQVVEFDDIDYIDAEEHTTAAAEAASGVASYRQRISDYIHRAFLFISIPAVIIVIFLFLMGYYHGRLDKLRASRGIAGFCALCATTLTIFLIYCHLTTYTNPKQQRYIIRILLMVPIYAIDSYIALWPEIFEFGWLMILIRNTYESYLLYNFYALLMDFMGGEEVCLRLWETETNGTVAPPCKCLRSVPLNAATLRRWKFYLTQYVVVNPLLTLLSVPLYFAGVYEEGVFAADNAFTYLIIIKVICTIMAFRSLVFFFLATKDFIKEHKPFAKFAAIKLVVFVFFWQMVIIAILQKTGVVSSHSQRAFTTKAVATGLQNFLTCIEMYLLSLLHRYVYDDAEYFGPTGRHGLKLWAVKHAFSIGDVVKDSREVLMLSPKGRGSHAETVESGSETVSTVTY